MNASPLFLKRLVLYSTLLVLVAGSVAVRQRLGASEDLLECVRLNDSAALRAVVRSHPDRVNQADKDGNTPLHWATLWDHEENAEILLDHGANVNATNHHGKTPLHWAATCGNVAVADLLLARGADPRARDEWDQTPLHSVFVLGPQFQPSLAIASRLIARGADLEARDKHGFTPLLWAVISKREESAAFLLSRGAQPDIFAAAGLGQLDRLKELIQGNPGLACATNNTGATPLHWATRAGRESVATWLLNQGANINARDANGFTPLHEASVADQPALTQLLLARGADLDARDNNGFTAAVAAVESGRDEVAQMLFAQMDAR